MRGVYITYWPAGGGRGQNPCRTGLAQGLDLCLKYGPRALCSQFYMSQGRLYVPREVDLADKTRVAALPSSCPPGQPPLGHIASLGTYRIVTRVPLGRIFRILSSSASSRPICLSMYCMMYMIKGVWLLGEFLLVLQQGLDYRNMYVFDIWK